LVFVPGGVLRMGSDGHLCGGSASASHHRRRLPHQPHTGDQTTWHARPALKIVEAFAQSLKKYPPIAPGTPDSYAPSVAQ
jgi:hypothetical protein